MVYASSSGPERVGFVGDIYTYACGCFLNWVMMNTLCIMHTLAHLQYQPGRCLRDMNEQVVWCRCWLLAQWYPKHIASVIIIVVISVLKVLCIYCGHLPSSGFSSSKISLIISLILFYYWLLNKCHNQYWPTMCIITLACTSINSSWTLCFEM